MLSIVNTEVIFSNDAVKNIYNKYLNTHSDTCNIIIHSNCIQSQNTYYKVIYKVIY